MTRAAVRTQTRVLVVNDGGSPQAGLALLLSSSGYDVECAHTGQEALDAVEVAPPDVLILDLHLPDMEGCEVCRGVRQRLNIPIIVLTARRNDADKIAALDEGADDYVMWPFSSDELLARVRAALQRNADTREHHHRLRLAGLIIDFDHHRVTREGHDLDVDDCEFELLAYLARHANRVLTYQTILRANPAVQTPKHLWDRIARLRRKIEVDPFRPRFLISEPWVGYRFVDGLL